MEYSAWVAKMHADGEKAPAFKLWNEFARRTDMLEYGVHSDDKTRAALPASLLSSLPKPLDYLELATADPDAKDAAAAPAIVPKPGAAAATAAAAASSPAAVEAKSPAAAPAASASAATPSSDKGDRKRSVEAPSGSASDDSSDSSKRRRTWAWVGAAAVAVTTALVFAGLRKKGGGKS